MKKHSRVLARILIEQLEVARSNHIKGVEVGVWQGHNSSHLLRSIPNLRLWMVDEYAERSDGEMAHLDQCDFDLARQQAIDATSFANDSRVLLAMDSKEGAAKFCDKELDFVFIDASHDYDSVKSDVESWHSKVRIGGIVSGHDYGGRKVGVKRAVDEVYGDRVRLAGGLVWWVKLLG